MVRPAFSFALSSGRSSSDAMFRSAARIARRIRGASGLPAVRFTSLLRWTEPRHVVPQFVEVDGQSGASGHRIHSPLGGSGGTRVAAAGELEDLERLQAGVEDPVEADAERCVLVHLLDPVTALIARSGGHNFDDDVRRNAHDPITRQAASVSVEV